MDSSSLRNGTINSDSDISGYAALYYDKEKGAVTTWQKDQEGIMEQDSRQR